LALSILAAGFPRRVLAQQAAPVAKTAPVVRPTPAKKPPHDKYGSPLDTIMNTHLTTTAPPAEDFVRATHPAEKDLDYTPLTGVDPVRPKPRDKANVMALQAELEQAGAIARGKGGVPARAKTRKPRTAE
jgi:hypothetical protein